MLSIDTIKIYVYIIAIIEPRDGFSVQSNGFSVLYSSC